MSPLHEALNFENVTGCGKNDYPLQFYAHCWIENEVVARTAQVVWPKLGEVLRYGWKMDRFKEVAKNSLATMANHIATKTPIQSYFARCTRSLNPM